MGDARPWRAARRLLCVRLDSIGDVLMTGPAFRGLAELAGAPVTVLTSPSGAEAARLMPGVGDVMVYEAPWMKATGPRRDAGTDFAMIEALRERRFDGAAIFTAYSQSPLPAAMLCYLADIPLPLAHCHENPYQILTDLVADPEPQDRIRHEVQRQIDLVTGVGARVGDPRLALEIPPSAAARVESLLAPGRLGRGEYVVIHPGSTAASRRYPAALFAEVVRAIGRASVPVVVTGTREERELAGEVLSGADGSTVNLAGCLAFEELTAVIDGARLLIGNNSGPVHIAAAIGTPVVDIYALTNPQHTPWGVPSRVLSNDVPCRWCYKSVCPEGHHLCLRGVRPAAVVAAAMELLHEESNAGANSVSHPVPR